ncbi:MAG TPA: PAS domain-containing sensor histidine kinase [Chitinophaga sp.]
MDQEKYSLFDHLIEGVQIISRDWKYLYVNEAISTHSMLSKERLLGNTLMEIYPGIEDTELFRRIKGCMQHCTTHKMMVEFNFPHRAVGYFDLRIQPVPEGVLILSIDVTEQWKAEQALKKSEEQYRMIFNGIQESFVLYDVITDDTGKVRDLRFVEVNPAAEKILGKTHEELIGHTRSEILGAMDPGAGEIVKKVLVMKEQVRTERFVPAVNRWFEVFTFLTQEGRIANLNLDITKRKQAEEQAHQLNLDLEERIRERTAELIASLQREQELSEMKSDFVSMASHEFRTPLSTLLTSVSLIEKYVETGEKEKSHKHLAKIKASVKTLTNILEDFLSLDKLQEGRIDVMKHSFELPPFVEKVIDDIKAICKRKQHIRYHHTGLTSVYLDSKILQNILMNLLSNAIKYSEQDIEVTTLVNDSAMNLTVTDKGIGIPEHGQEKLFKQFFRAPNVNNIQGTGLGLYIVKRYLDLLNGNIDFTSKENEGTTFRVYFPLHH